MDILSVVFIICTAQFILVGIFLTFYDKAVEYGMRWLGAFFLFLALNFLDGLLFLNGFYLSHPDLAFLEDPAAFLFGPFLYFFARNLSQKPLSPILKLVHLIPFTLCFFLVLFTYHLNPRADKLEILQHLSQLELPPQAILVIGIVFIHFFIYAISARRSIITYKQKLHGYFSSAETSWSLKITNALLTIFTLSLSASLIEYFGYKWLYEIALFLIAIITAFFAFNILLKALKEPLFRIPYEKDFGQVSTDENERETQAKIKAQLEKHKIFMEPELTLADLADKLDMSPRQVSYVINKHMAKNFYELINGYRIQEAMTLLENSNERNITQIMYESGFNSKSSFNTQFKKITGLTPSAYKTRNKKAD